MLLSVPQPEVGIVTAVLLGLFAFALSSSSSASATVPATSPMRPVTKFREATARDYAPTVNTSLSISVTSAVVATSRPSSLLLSAAAIRPLAEAVAGL